MLQFVPLILIFGIVYFFMIRPQQKRMREHKAMIEALKRGDKLVTNAGFIGRIEAVRDNEITLELAPGVVVKMLKNAVAEILPKETDKADKADKKEATKPCASEETVS